MEEKENLCCDADIDIFGIEEEKNICPVEIKPCYNYQSITITMYADLNNLEPLFKAYENVLKGLKELTDRVLKEEDVNFEPATERQKEIMDHFKIVYPKHCSNERAQKLIEKSIAKNKKK